MFQFYSGLRFLKLVVGFIGCAFILGCGPSSDNPESHVESGAVEADEIAIVDVSGGDYQDGNDIVDDQSDEVCGSVKPALDYLPLTKNIGIYNESFRGCSHSTGIGVVVGYDSPAVEDSLSSYQFLITVLDGNSPLAASNVNIPNATTDQKAFFAKAITGTGEMIKGQWDICRHYATTPIRFDGRNPEIANFKGMDVCITDRMDASRDVWRAIGVYKNLGFELEMSGSEAEKILTTLIAKEHLMPIFGLFQFE